MIHALQAEKATTSISVSTAPLLGAVTTPSGRSLPSLGRMAEMLGVSRSGYYAWLARTHGPDGQGVDPGPRAARREELLAKITAAHRASDGVNGAPRIVADLRDAGEVVSRKTVAKLMRQNEIRGISPRPWRPVTTIGDGRVHSIPDLVNRQFDRGELNKVWTSDITYLRTDQGWLYLCAVRDGCSRRVIGYAFSPSLHTDVVETALRRAVTFRDGLEPHHDAGIVDHQQDAHDLEDAKVIFHADRGTQYTSTQLALAAGELGARLSVGRTGVCWDNAQQESFWSTLKTEFYDRHHFATHTDAAHAVSSWIEDVYNRRRRHSALGMTNPVAFERQLTTAAEAVSRCPPDGVNPTVNCRGLVASLSLWPQSHGKRGGDHEPDERSWVCVPLALHWSREVPKTSAISTRRSFAMRA